MRRRIVIQALAGSLLTWGVRRGHAAPPQKPRIALVFKTLANPYFAEMEHGARLAAERVGAELVVRAAAQETSTDEQIAIIKDQIEAQVQAIIITPSDSVKLVPVLKLAKDKGIVVINVDNRLDRDFCLRSGLGEVPFISVDNVKAAYLAASAIARDVTTPTEAAIIEGIRSAANAQARKIGALKAFAENAHIKVVAMETANWLGDEAYDVTGKMVGKHPNLGLLFCANDVMALGVLRFLKDQKLRHIKVAGFDALPEAVQAVENGGLAATVDQQASVQGGLAVELASARLAGRSVPLESFVEVKVVTKAAAAGPRGSPG